MVESVVGETQKLIQNLKNNNSGNLKLKNGRLYVEGPNTYTTITGTTFGNEAVKGNEGNELRRAKNATNHTGNIYVQNGRIYANGYGKITLVD